MNKFKKIFLMTLSLISGTLFANEDVREEKHVPVVFSIFSNEFLFASKKDISANAAVGLLGSTLYEVNGIQLSSLYNITHEVNGAQLSGLFNLNTSDFSGGQLSSIFNIAGGSLKGLQAACVFNSAEGVSGGVQTSGVMNITGNQGMSGLQAAGVLNVAGGESGAGLQSAGVMNVYRGDFHGAQVGLINICSGDCGFQFGLINIAKNGVFEIATSYTSNHNLRFALNTGNKFCYTVLGLKCGNKVFLRDSDNHLVLDDFIVVAGLGTRQEFGCVNIDLEALYNNVITYEDGKDSDSASFLSGRLSVGYKIVKHLNIFCGYSIGFEHEDFCNSDKAFEHIRSNLETRFDNGLVLHHEFDFGAKFMIN